MQRLNAQQSKNQINRQKRQCRMRAQKERKKANTSACAEVLDKRKSFPKRIVP